MSLYGRTLLLSWVKAQVKSLLHTKGYNYWGDVKPSVETHFVISKFLEYNSNVRDLKKKKSLCSTLFRSISVCTGWCWLTIQLHWQDFLVTLEFCSFFPLNGPKRKLMYFLHSLSASLQSVDHEKLHRSKQVCPQGILPWRCQSDIYI